MAIARALVGEPAILLADEPTGNLDSRTSSEIMDLFDELQADGQTIIMVTHEPDIAARCQRVMRLEDGKVAVGHPAAMAEVRWLMFMFWESLRAALESIRAHGFRSLLTSLGIIIGVMSVIGVVSIVQGLSHTVNQQFEGLGSNTLTVRSYTPFKKVLQGKMAKLRHDDYLLLAERVDGVSHISPVLFHRRKHPGPDCLPLPANLFPGLRRGPELHGRQQRLPGTRARLQPRG